MRALLVAVVAALPPPCRGEMPVLSLLRGNGNGNVVANGIHAPTEGHPRPRPRHHAYEDVARRMNDLFEATSRSGGYGNVGGSGVSVSASSSSSSSSSSGEAKDAQGRRNLRATGPAAAAASAEAGPDALPRNEEAHRRIEEMFDNARDVEEIMMDVGAGRDGPLDDDDNVGPEASDAGATDFYAGLPAFVARGGGEAEPRCACVDCAEDAVCGGIWKRERFVPLPGNGGDQGDEGGNDGDGKSPSSSTEDPSKLKVHVVVSHCLSDLDWLASFTSSHPVASLHVISKCGGADRARRTAPAYATVEEYANVGRCDHTYAHYITTVLPRRVRRGEEANSVAIFLKDDVSAANFHQSGHWNDFDGLVKAAASEHGFGCGIIPGGVDFGQDSFDLSTYHETHTLHLFAMDTYQRSKGGMYKIDLSEFQSEYHSLGEWWHAMGAPDAPEAMQVCYGGVFSGSIRNIYKSTDIDKIMEGMDSSLWKNVERSLSRGNNIQEGHYAERSWAPMIQTQLPGYQLEALLAKADGVYINKSSFHGALLRRPKLFVHVGEDGAGALAHSLVSKMNLLKLDGYRVAVQGRHEDGAHGFPNIDRLGACLWSDMNKSLLPLHIKAEAGVCDKQTLPALSRYMKETFERSEDMVLSSPWLNMPGSAEPLDIYLDNVWDVKVVIYYRRFFEWLKLRYDEFREETIESMSQNDLSASYRFVDYLREQCRQLFYGKDVSEDGFPIRKLHRHSNRSMGRTTTAVSRFDPTTNYNLEELVGLEDYAYFAAGQYHRQARFRQGIKIVNYHDVHSAETKFYCWVLHDAANSCNDAIRAENKTLESEPDNGGPPLGAGENPLGSVVNEAHALLDIAIEAYRSGRLSFDASQPRKKFASQVTLWTVMIAQALQGMDIAVDQLPTECLYKYERMRLLEASLAYEKSLLPDFYASPNGASKLKRDFGESAFCSVDVDAILSDPRWDFLFEDAADFSVTMQHRALVHVGALDGAGAKYFEQALAENEDTLKEDKYLVFSAQGHLAPCVWTDEQRQVVASRSGEAPDSSSCHEHLLPAFHQLLSNATAADSDVIVYDEWLSLPSSEKGLLEVLDDKFDPVVVIGYRRFFDWLLMSHYQRHLIDEGAQTQRLVDFVRLICSRLFAAEMRYPGQRLVDLPQAQDYTYSSWKRYTDVPAYEGNVKILNYEDGKVVQSFYCDVLKAEKACALETERQHNVTVSAEIEGPALVPTYVELALGLNPDNDDPEDRLIELGKMYERKLAQRDLSADDLPKECLRQAELNMLLKVSLEYERILLPQYSSGGGEAEMRRHFATRVANDAFCSVDLKQVTESPRWQFVLEEQSVV